MKCLAIRIPNDASILTKNYFTSFTNHILYRNYGAVDFCMLKYKRKVSKYMMSVCGMHLTRIWYGPTCCTDIAHATALAI